MAAITVTAGWNFTQNKSDVSLSDLALSNVEDSQEDVGYIILRCLENTGAIVDFPDIKKIIVFNTLN